MPRDLPNAATCLLRASHPGGPQFLPRALTSPSHRQRHPNRILLGSAASPAPPTRMRHPARSRASRSTSSRSF